MSTTEATTAPERPQRRTSQVQLRLDDTTFERVESFCRKTGMTRSVGIAALLRAAFNEGCDTALLERLALEGQKGDE